MKIINSLKLFYFKLLVFYMISVGAQNISVANNTIKINNSKITNQTTPMKDKPILQQYNFTIIHSHSHSSSELPYLSSFERKTKESAKNLVTTNDILNFHHKKSQMILDMIHNHNLKLKGQICKYSTEILNSFEKIKEEISKIKEFFNSNQINSLTKTDLYLKITVSINNVNLIKALLIKISHISETLKSSRCLKVEDLSKDKLFAESQLNSLVENIQDFIRKQDLHISLVILS